MLARPEELSKGEGKAGQQFEPLLPGSVCMNLNSLPLHKLLLRGGDSKHVSRIPSEHGVHSLESRGLVVTY